MQDITTNLYPCKHCNETGICNNGKESCSCQSCVKYHSLKLSKEYMGLACGICNGLGQAEPITERMNKRTKPVLAIIIVLSLLTYTFLLAVTKNPHFPEFLAFSGTLIGAVSAFYFSHVKQTL